MAKSDEVKKLLQGLRQLPSRMGAHVERLNDPPFTEAQNDALTINHMRQVLQHVRHPNSDVYEDTGEKAAANLLLGSLNVISKKNLSRLHPPVWRSYPEINKAELLAAVVALNPHGSHTHEAELPEGFRKTQAYQDYLASLDDAMIPKERPKPLPPESDHSNYDEALAAYKSESEHYEAYEAYRTKNNLGHEQIFKEKHAKNIIGDGLDAMERCLDRHHHETVKKAQRQATILHPKDELSGAFTALINNPHPHCTPSPVKPLIR